MEVICMNTDLIKTHQANEKQNDNAAPVDILNKLPEIPSFEQFKAPRLSDGSFKRPSRYACSKPGQSMGTSSNFTDTGNGSAYQ
jgi:hypothetical protein